MQGVVLGGSVWLLYATGPERIYGWLEHQNTLKLHVIYSISEVQSLLIEKMLEPKEFFFANGIRYLMAS